jgi:2Fe-2S ferredoxin
MPLLDITDRLGRNTQLQAATSSTLMEAIRDAGLADAFAICGGCLSCATCHVYIEDADGVELSAMGEDENDLLSESGYRRATSRLSCQLSLAAVGARLVATIAPEE